jgi:hypothetical protein
METTQRGLFAVFLGEPIDLVKAQPHQLFISTASVALMGLAAVLVAIGAMTGGSNSALSGFGCLLASLTKPLS